MKKRILNYWDTCVNVDGQSEITLTELVLIDEYAKPIAMYQMAELTGQCINRFNQTHGIVDFECCVYPDLTEPEFAFIYDRDKDIHYLFK